MDLAGGRGLLRRLRFEIFLCQNERIWTLGGRVPGSPPLGPPMVAITMQCYYTDDPGSIPGP